MAISHFRVVAAVPVVVLTSFVLVAAPSRLPRSLSCRFFLLLLLLCTLMCIVERIVDLSCYPQAVQEHRELSRYGYHRSFLGVLGSASSDLLSMTS